MSTPVHRDDEPPTGTHVPARVRHVTKPEVFTGLYTPVYAGPH